MERSARGSNRVCLSLPFQENNAEMAHFSPMQSVVGFLRDATDDSAVPAATYEYIQYLVFLENCTIHWMQR